MSNNMPSNSSRDNADDTDWDSPEPLPGTLAERAALMAELIAHRGWQLLAIAINPRIKTRIVDADDREAFLYEAIRLQAIQEILTLPSRVIDAYRKRS